MTRAATWVASLSGWRRACFAVLLGALSVLAFAPLHLWPVLFLTFGPLIWLLDGCHRDHAGLGPRLKCASLIGFWFGFGYFLAGLYWVAEAFLVEPWRHGWLIPFVMTAFPAGMALFFVAAVGARHADVAAGNGPGVRARHRLRTRRVCPRPCADRASLEPDRLCACSVTCGMMQLASLFGVYALEPARRSAVRGPCRDLHAGGLALHAVPRNDPAHRRSLDRTRRRRPVGRTGGSPTPRVPAPVSALAHRPGRYRSGRKVASREQRRDLHRLSRPRPSRGRLGWTASRSSCGRRPRCRSFSPSRQRRAPRSAKPCRKGTVLLAGSARLVEERDTQGAAHCRAHL